jgi:hypothetical protein
MPAAARTATAAARAATAAAKTATTFATTTIGDFERKTNASNR